MNKRRKLNSGHYFEVLDRCHCMMMNLDSHLLSHPALTKKQFRKIEKAQGLLMDVYQWAGKKFDDMEEQEAQ